MAECKCYVQYLDPETRFVVRYGSHNPCCPVFRPSLDPVDAVADAHFRLAQESKTLVRAS